MDNGMGLIAEARARIDAATAAIQGKHEERRDAAAMVARCVDYAHRGDLDAAARIEPAKARLAAVDRELLSDGAQGGPSPLYRELYDAQARLAELLQARDDLRLRVKIAAVKANALEGMTPAALREACALLVRYFGEFPPAGEMGGDRLINYLRRLPGRFDQDFSELDRLCMTLARY